MSWQRRVGWLAIGMLLAGLIMALAGTACARDDAHPAFGAKPRDSRIPLRFLEHPRLGEPDPDSSPNVKPTGPVHSLAAITRAWELVRGSWSAEEAAARLERTFGPGPWRFEGPADGQWWRLMIRSVRDGPPMAPLLPTIRVELIYFSGYGEPPALQWLDLTGGPAGPPVPYGAR